jgi:hypothetical protein
VTIKSLKVKAKDSFMGPKTRKKFRNFIPLFLLTVLFGSPSALFAADPIAGAGTNIAQALCNIVPIFTPIGYAIAVLVAVIALVQFIGGNREGIAKALTVIVAAIILGNGPALAVKLINTGGGTFACDATP